MGAYLRGEGGRGPAVPSLRALSAATNHWGQAQPHEADSPDPSPCRAHLGGGAPDLCPLPTWGLPSLGHTHHARAGQKGGGEQHSGDGPLPALGLSLCKCSPCGLPRQGTRAVSTPSRIASPMAIATGQPSQQPAGTAWPGRPTVSTPCGPMAITASVHLYLPQVSPFYMLPFPEHLQRPNPMLSALCTLSHSLGTALQDRVIPTLWRGNESLREVPGSYGMGIRTLPDSKVSVSSTLTWFIHLWTPAGF